MIKNLQFKILGILMFASVMTGCKSLEMDKEKALSSFPEFLKEGHRGTRGLMPENTIPSMLKAIEEGSNVIEVDIHISKDNQVVVAHDPYINPEFTLLPNGEEIPEKDAKKYLLLNMDYSEIRKFDVGSKFHKGYPQQEKMKTYIPLLGELIDSVESFTAENKYPKVIYNIEIKADPAKDGIYQPTPEVIHDLLMEVLDKKDLGINRFYIQSFDIRQLQTSKEEHPEVILGFLTSNKKKTFEENLKSLGFNPDIYSPNYKLVSPELIEKAHQKGIKIVPWTVNTLEEMKPLINMGVDGIITDYPNLFKELNL